MFKYLKIGICLLFVIWCLGFYSFASAKEYDGIWFLGFNVKQPPFNNLWVRQAVSHALNKQYITYQLAGEDVVPASVIPPGLGGFEPKLKPFKYSVSYAKTMLKRAKYPFNDPALKKLTLLHTDGVKTIKIANKIKSDLAQLGMEITLVEVNYSSQEVWDRALASNKYPLFLMGYKADKDSSSAEADTLSLLSPLFRSNGNANFTGYDNSEVNLLFDQAAAIDPLNPKNADFKEELRDERNLKLQAINKLLYKEIPVIVLFYIEKL